MRVRLSYKLWLESNGKAFGEGPCRLLEGVDRTGSLRQAAAGMGMSYSQAWHLIRTIEGRLGFPLIHRRAGGSSGGGSEVTPEGRRLMEAYQSFREEAREAMEKLFAKHFGPAEG